MNEKDVAVEETIVESPESMPDAPENMPENTESPEIVPENMEVPETSGVPENGGIETSDSLENEETETSERLYDRLVKDIAEELKGDSVEKSGDVGLSDGVSDGVSGFDAETDGEAKTVQEVPEIPQIPVIIQKEDVSGNDIPLSDILDYLKGQETSTSIGMPFGEAKLSDLTVTDGLLLIILVVFLFRWLFDFGRNLF